MIDVPSPEFPGKLRGSVTGAAGLIVEAVLSSAWPEGGREAPAAGVVAEDMMPGNGESG